MPPAPPRTQALSPMPARGHVWIPGKALAPRGTGNVRCDALSLCREVRQSACCCGRACEGAHGRGRTEGAVVSGWTGPGPGKASLDPSPSLLMATQHGGQVVYSTREPCQGLLVRACGGLCPRLCPQGHTCPLPEGVHTATHKGLTRPTARPGCPRGHPESPGPLTSGPALLGDGVCTHVCASPWAVVCHHGTRPEDRCQAA